MAIAVEVMYAEARGAIVATYRLDAPAVVADVLRLAARDPLFAGVEIARAGIGVFGKPAGAEQVLRDGDRVELYRALAADPKSARRARARETTRKP